MIFEVFNFLGFLAEFEIYIYIYIVGGRPVMNMEETSKRRLFFSTPDELCDEEFYDDQSPEKKRRLSPEQVP